MKTAIIYYSKHHHNTKKILEVIKAEDEELVLIDVTAKEKVVLDEFDNWTCFRNIFWKLR